MVNNYANIINFMIKSKQILDKTKRALSFVYYDYN